MYCCITHDPKAKQLKATNCSITVSVGQESRRGLAGWFGSEFLMKLYQAVDRGCQSSEA